MKEKIIKILNVIMIVLAIVYIFINKINITRTLITALSVVVSSLLILCIYQKFIKHNRTFKLYKDYEFLGTVSIIFIIASILLKNNALVMLIELLSIIIFHFATFKVFKNERYIATILLAALELVFVNSLSSAIYIAVISLTILGIETLDVTDHAAYYRKRNILVITLSEILLTYLTITNYSFILFYLLFVIYLIKKLTLKPAIKSSCIGVLISVIMLVVSLFIKVPFISTKYVLSSGLLNTLIVIQSVLIILTYLSKFKSEEKKIDTAESLLLLVSLIIIIVTKNHLEYNVILSILLIITYAKELEKLPRIIDRKIKLVNKSSLNKNISDIKEVTAVIPNYNYENYIEERIDSVIFQTYPIKELIILDDVSKDNSVEVIKNKLKEINEKYPSLKTRFIPNKKNSGNVFKQWKKCFEESNTDYLWICEADDSASPYFLENIMKLFEKDEDVILAHSESLTMDENNNIMMNNLREWVDIYKTDRWKSNFIYDGKEFNRKYLVINNTIANVSGAVFKKKKNVPFEKYLDEAQEYKLAGDWYFYENVLEYGKIAYCRKSLNYHRMHSSSVTLTTKREKEYEEICRIQNDIMSRHKLDKEVKENVFARREKFRFDYGFCEDELELAKIDLKDILKKKKIKDDILLSVIIPVYNTEPFLEKCLNSVIKAIPEKTEVIIINDGTPDNSEKIIKKFAKEYKDIIKYHKKKNGGLSDTKNYGLAHAKGKYIGFVDSDDYIKENMFSCMLKKALLDNADMVYCDVEMVYEDGSYRYVKSTNYDEKDKLYKHLDTSLMPASWSKIVKKELFKGLDYPKGYNNEDVAVSPILFARSKQISKVDTPFYKYFQRTGSIQNSGFNEKRFVVFYTANLCFERAKEFDNKTQEKIKGCIYTHQLFGLLFYLITEEKNKKKRLSYLERFAKEINKFEDYDKNSYLIKYVKLHNRLKVFKYLKEEKIKRLDFYLKTGI